MPELVLIMTFIAFVLILLSVVLHALWHFLNKSGKPSYAFFAVFSFSLFCTMLTVSFFGGVPLQNFSGRAWLFAMLGGFFGMLGDVGFSHAYRNADISLAYPVSRALPVLLTSGVTALFGWGSPLGAAALCGMAVVFAGCVVMSIPDPRRMKKSDFFNRGMGGILLAACATTGYTIGDGYGIRAVLESVPESPRLFSAALYSCMREGFVLLFLAPVVLADRRQRANLNRSLLLNYRPYLAGVFAAVAYVLVLVAMGYVTNVSYVQAFRQMSLPVGMFLGIVILHEKPTPGKFAGLGLILTGLLLVAFRS